MICKKCGALNEDDARFCENCGANLQSEEPTKAVAKIPKIEKDKIFLVAIILILIVGLLFYFFGRNLFKKDETEVPTLTKESSGATYIIGSFEEDTVAKMEYDYISYEGELIDESSMTYLDNMIEEKTRKTGVDIHLYLGDVEEPYYTSDDYIWVFISQYSEEADFVTNGKGNSFITKKAKESINESIEYYLENSLYYDACKRIIDAIPDKVVPSEFIEVEGAQQVVYVKKDKGATTGKLTLVEWDDGVPEVVYKIDRVYLGMDGITDSPSESKSATPKGVFKLGFAFSDHSLNTDLDTELITSGAVWVNDPNSAHYNTLQYGSTRNEYWSSAEDTYAILKGNYNDACILIEHNGDGYSPGERGKGSCIYVAGKNSGLTTSYGDVNITADQMRKLLSYLDEEDNPHIVIN